jgi:hypothetical protein
MPNFHSSWWAKRQGRVNLTVVLGIGLLMVWFSLK